MPGAHGAERHAIRDILKAHAPRQVERLTSIDAERWARGLGAVQGGVAEGIGSQHANANLAFGAVD